MPKQTDFIAGMLTGALVGASLAMVLAPAPETDTRERLRAKARENAARIESPADSPLT
jgi:gas vesicle protein